MTMIGLGVNKVLGQGEIVEIHCEGSDWNGVIASCYAFLRTNWDWIAMKRWGIYIFMQHCASQFVSPPWLYTLTRGTISFTIDDDDEKGVDESFQSKLCGSICFFFSIALHLHCQPWILFHFHCAEPWTDGGWKTGEDVLFHLMLCVHYAYHPVLMLFCFHLTLIFCLCICWQSWEERKNIRKIWRNIVRTWSRMRTTTNFSTNSRGNSGQMTILGMRRVHT